VICNVILSTQNKNIVPEVNLCLAYTCQAASLNTLAVPAIATDVTAAWSVRLSIDPCVTTLVHPIKAEMVLWNEMSFSVQGQSIVWSHTALNRGSRAPVKRDFGKTW